MQLSAFAKELRPSAEMFLCWVAELALAKLPATKSRYLANYYNKY